MQPIHLHLVSDSTGETLESLVKAGLAQFENVDTVKHFWPMVRSEGHLDRVVDEIARRPGLILYTLVAPAVRARLEARCAALGLPLIAVLDPVIEGLQRALGRRAHARPGRQHVLDEAYFDRIRAITYTIEHDDGVGAHEWNEADAILVGVSRSSKTPTSIYLANRGYKIANMPLVPNRPLPPEFDTLDHPLIVGLTVSPDRLVAIRRNRVMGMARESMAPMFDAHYVDPVGVASELSRARRLFADRGWPIIDVTRRSIEETAAAVIHLLTLRAAR
ncbi:MAG: pyruvate, water dikinase regulatory protein [Sphingomonadaceae bacterium]